MANSRFEYVRAFEQKEKVLYNTYVVVRLDGKGFHKFCKDHNFAKPHDYRGINLMSDCAYEVMKTFDVALAYGYSDEYSFVIDRKSMEFGRRYTKLLTSIVSLFSSSFALKWKDRFPDQELMTVPIFEGKLTSLPTYKNLRDFLAYRQADCHVNSLYNTCFWAMVLKGGEDPAVATDKLRKTSSSDKNEILFNTYGINYNELPEVERKGTVLFRAMVPLKKTRKSGKEVEKMVQGIRIESLDIIGDKFWKENPNLVSGDD